MNSEEAVATQIKWKSLLGDWSYLDFKCNDLLIVLVPHLLKEFPSQELFAENHDFIQSILILHLTPKRKAKWGKSEENLGEHDKLPEENHSKERKIILQHLSRQMTKLKNHMFIRPMMKSWGTKTHVPSKIKPVKAVGVKRKSTTSSPPAAVKKTNKPRQKTILDEDYDGTPLIGTDVCHYFPKVKGSDHKPAFYDGKIVSYNKE